ncbi:MAG TPA: hypothetical protein VIV60_30040 [Polyangiaceae bacterium]
MLESTAFTRARILIAHNSRAVRSIVRRRTLAEAPDFLVEEAETADEVARRVVQGAFDIVICDEALIGSADRDWPDEVRRQSSLLRLSYIFIVSEATTALRRSELSEIGSHTFLDAKCTGADIASAIATVFDPRHRRVFRRVSIPGTHARIRAGRTEMGADVVNISVAGMLCDLSCPEDFAAIIQLNDISIRFPSEYDSEIVDGMRGRMLRLQVLSRHVDHTPERIRVAWQFVDVPKDTYNRLDLIVKYADDEAPPESRSL